jgi:hypothetical protein
MRAATSLVVLLALAAAPAVPAEIYRWVDEKGMVNYGAKPPEGAKKVKQLDQDAVTVSTVPAPPPPSAQRQRQRELALEARIERLERELYELERARSAVPVVMPASPAYAPMYAAYPAFFPAYGHRFAARAVFPRRDHAVVRHAPVRFKRR